MNPAQAMLLQPWRMAMQPAQQAQPVPAQPAPAPASNDDEDTTKIPGLATAAPPPATGYDAIDPQTGFRQGDIQEAAFGRLGQMGAILLAAGQRMSGADRGSILSKLANVDDNTASVYRSSQARLMNTQNQQKQTEASNMNTTLKAILASRDIPDAEKAYAASDLKGYLAAKYNTDNRLDDDYTRKFNAAIKAGMDPNTARNAVFGTGDDRHYTNYGFWQNGKFTPANFGGDSGTQPQTAASGSEGNPDRRVPVDPGLAFGWGAAVHNVTGTVRPFLGGSKSNEDSASTGAQTNVKILNNEINAQLAKDYSGRATNYALKMTNLMPEPGKLFTSPEDARDKYAEALGPLQEMTDQHMALLQSLKAAPTAANLKQIPLVEQKIRKLTDTRATVQNMILNLNASIQGTAPPSLDDARAAAARATGGTGQSGGGKANPLLGAAQQYLGE
jgi:hypothetical protein